MSGFLAEVARVSRGGIVLGGEGGCGRAGLVQDSLDGGPPFIREGMRGKRAILTVPHGRGAGE